MKTIIDAEDSYSSPLLIRSTTGFSLSIKGTFVATVTLQRIRSTDAPEVTDDWADVESYDAPIQENGMDFGTHWYRVGCKAGEFTSGSVTVEINM